MSRDWFKVHAPMAEHEKWLGLSPSGRGAWITLGLLGVRTEGRFAGRKQVDALLRRDGFDPAVLDELVDGHLIDVEADGALVMHDWLDHQGKWRGPSDDPEAKAARSKASYERHSATAGDSRRESVTEEKRVVGEEIRETYVAGARDDDVENADHHHDDDADLQGDIAYRKYMSDAANRLDEAEKHAASERPAVWLAMKDHSW